MQNRMYQLWKDVGENSYFNGLTVQIDVDWASRQVIVYLAPDWEESLEGVYLAEVLSQLGAGRPEAYGLHEYRDYEYPPPGPQQQWVYPITVDAEDLSSIS